LDDIQRSAFKTVPVVPLGQVVPKTAYRSNIEGVLTASSSLFWNLRRS
jgi:peptide/nickel transport system substrate-binding protein